VATSINNVLIIFEDNIVEEVVFQVLPNVFNGVEFGGIGRQLYQSQVSWNPQAVAFVPSSPIDNQDRVMTRLYVEADFQQVFIHGIGIGKGRNNGSPRVSRRTDGTENIAIGKPLILGVTWTGAFFRPSAG
jgi:hypothetical protein